MHSRTLTSFAASAAVVAARATLQYPRADNATTFTGVFVKWESVLLAAEFTAAAPAGYVPDAPGFDVDCDAGSFDFITCHLPGTQPSPWPSYTTVTAYMDYHTLVITLKDQFIGPDGLRIVRTAAGKPNADQYRGRVDPYEFTFTVSDEVEILPGVIGNYGKWIGSNIVFPYDRYTPFLNYTLSAPDDYIPGAPGFTVDCFYNVYGHEPGTTWYNETCTPVGDMAPGSKVNQLSSFGYPTDYETIVHHLWTAANGTVYKTDGTGYFNGNDNGFYIEPHELYTVM
ncbi:hypothetical protein F4803DRAFT_117138 [Xylaria telfairii]|nr:hypothetical protein F4803DRAFT_117138 [Xylaria telfairii]